MKRLLALTLLPCLAALRVAPPQDVRQQTKVAEPQQLKVRRAAPTVALGDRRASATDPTYAYWVEQQMPAIPVVPQKVSSLLAGLEQPQVPQGLILEFGVWSGRTISVIAQHRPSSAVYGFDSFEGLPEAWRPGFGKEAFDTNGNMPAVPANVHLVKGWFDATLPGFLAAHPGPAAFIHVDCDVYSSARTVLETLAPRIVPGTVIVFDELVNYPQYREHELKAFYEFVRDHGRAFSWVSAMCPVALEAAEGAYECQGVAVRITS